MISDDLLALPENEDESATDVFCRYLLQNNPNDVALRLFLDVCIDFCNEWDKLDLMYELWQAMVDGDYQPTCNLFSHYLSDSIGTDGKLKYIPQDEDELNEVIDRYQYWKKAGETFRKEMFEKHGVIWDGLSLQEKMEIQRKDIQEMYKNIEPPEGFIRTEDYIPDEPKDNDDDDYTDLPF